MTNLRKAMAEISNKESPELLILFSVTAGIIIILTLIFLIFYFSEKLYFINTKKRNCSTEEDFVYFHQNRTAYSSIFTQNKTFSNRVDFVL